MSTNIFCRGNYRDVVGVRFIDSLDSVTEIGCISLYRPLRALLCETPVIVTDDCGCGELIKETEAGILSITGMWPSSLRRSGLLLSTWMSIGGWLKAGRRYVEEHLAWASVVKQVEAMYEGCVHYV